MTTFRECDVEDRFEVFFVNIGSTTLRRWVCVECGEDHEIDEPPAKPSAREISTLAARPLPTPARRSVSEADKERMLEDLKRRMGSAKKDR